MAIILVTAAQLIFFTTFHKYIAWPIPKPDGSVAWLSMLTDGNFTCAAVPAHSGRWRDTGLGLARKLSSRPLGDAARQPNKER
jgi:hypothetical protein